MSNGEDIIKIFLMFVTIFSAVGLVFGLLTLSDIGDVEDMPNLSGEELGWKIADMLIVVIILIFGCIISGIVILFLRDLI